MFSILLGNDIEEETTSVNTNQKPLSMINSDVNPYMLRTTDLLNPAANLIKNDLIESNSADQLSEIQSENAIE